MKDTIDLIKAVENHRGLRHQNAAWRYLQESTSESVMAQFAELYRNQLSVVSDESPASGASVPHTGHMSPEGVALVKRWEGCELHSYRCSSNIVTCGYGHTGPDVYEGMTITQAQADQWLAKDLARFEEAIDRQINVALSQPQFDALVSWCFNVGEGATAESTLRRRLNNGEDPCTVISQELPRWNKGPNGPIQGLTNRRADEVRHAGCAG